MIIPPLSPRVYGPRPKKGVAKRRMVTFYDAIAIFALFGGIACALLILVFVVGKVS